MQCGNCGTKVLPNEYECSECGTRRSRHPSLTPEDLIGRRIAGRYRLMGLIGRGSMGRVFLAEDETKDSPVAIKLLHRRLVQDDEDVRRFHREAKAAQRVEHENVIVILEYGEEEDGLLYMVMEYLDGDSLLAILKHDAPLSPRRIADLLSQILRALASAHASDVIHRDLKPENVIVLEHTDGTEHVKVLDFGIAKIQGSSKGSGITKAGFVCGTPEYMAPEQARGKGIDARSDVYAAGCVLYQMLTGEVPFKGPTALEVISKQVNEEPIPPSVRTPEHFIPHQLEDVALRAMSKKPDKRFSSADEMRNALLDAVDSLSGAYAEAPLGSRPPPARPAGSMPPKTLPSDPPPGSASVSESGRSQPDSTASAETDPSQASAARAQARFPWLSIIVLAFISALAVAAMFARDAGTRRPTPPSSTSAPTNTDSTGDAPTSPQLEEQDQ